jgi:hypothetical protein
MTSTRFLQVLGILFVVALLFAFSSCGDKAPSDKAEGEDHAGHTHATKQGDDHAGHTHDAAQERPKRPAKIPPAVMDSLRVMKKRYGVTRDEYWDDKGGILANDFVEVHYPPGPTTVTHGMHTLEQIVFAREKCRSYWGEVPAGKLEVICTEEMEDYTKETGREWWHYSKIEDDKITFQPIYILYQRGLGEIAIAHEYHEWAIGKLTGGKMPRLLAEGFASYLSGEKDLLRQQVAHLSEEDIKMTPEEVESTLKQESKKDRSRVAYYHALRLVTGILFHYGDDGMQQVMRRMHDGVTLDSAFQKMCDKTYEEVLRQVADYKGDA